MPNLIQRVARGLLHMYPFRRGVWRLIDRGYLMRFADSELTVRCRGGFDMRIPPNDLIGRNLYYTGKYESTVVDVFWGFCRGGERILDIGANIGYVSCALLKCVPGSFVTAVEPQSDCFRLLCENLAQFGRRSNAIQAAVAAETGVAQMVGEDGNTGAAHIVKHSELRGDAFEVATIDGAELMHRSEMDGLDIVKIDVEGFERVVLQTMREPISRWRPRAILFEHHGDLRDSTLPLREFFAGLRYKVYGIRKSMFNWHLEPLDGPGAGKQMSHDYLAQPCEGV